MELALFQLLALRLRGGVRLRLQQLLSLRGLIYFGISCAVPVFIWLALMQTNAGSSELAADTSMRIETFLVLGLAAATLFPALMTTSPAFQFSPEEVHFLRAGPFSRQSLLIYKVLSAASGAALSGLLLAVVTCVLYGRLPASVFFGTLLTMLFVRLSGATLRSTWQLVSSARAPSSLPRSNPAFVVSMLGLIAWLVLVCLGRAPIEVVLDFCETPIGEYLLLPFKAFVRVTLADRMFPDLIFWTAFAVAINLCLLLVLLRFENIIDSFADDSSSQDQNRIMHPSTGWVASSTVAERMMSYRLAVVGPIAWRQFVQARRSAGAALMGLSVLAILGGPILVFGLSGYSSLARIGIAITFAIFVLPKTMTFDFRGDVNSLASLKGLPLRPIAIVLGQLTTPAVLSSCIELLFLGSTMCLVSEASFSNIAALVPFVLPFNILLYSLENVTFLLVPFRVLPTGRVDFEFFGRSVVEILAKMLVLGLVITVAIRTGRMAGNVMGGSAIVFYASTWLGMVLAAAIAVLIVACVFKRSELRWEA